MLLGSNGCYMAHGRCLFSHGCGVVPLVDLGAVVLALWFDPGAMLLGLMGLVYAQWLHRALLWVFLLLCLGETVMPTLLSLH
ncbi:hypothetical protein U1Q18_045062 [Sarracenia purpurea var. burkii]